MIFHSHKGYPERRNFLNSRLVRFKQSVDVFKLICHISFKWLNNIPQWGLNLYWHPFKSRKATLHFFNGIALSRQRFVTTFETALPRLGKVPTWLNSWAVKRLAGNDCLGLIAISQCTYNIQKQFLEEKHPHLSAAIMAKTIVLHPPQPVLVERVRERVIAPVIFTFVGNQFFGKGGREILATFQKLHAEGYNFQLNIISNFSPDGYASHTTQKDTEELNARFATLPPSISIIGKLPNNELLTLLKQSHVALMPTYADTYGYFVLEAQACGCPVITTDIRALPEINNNECGWVIKVPKDTLGNGVLHIPEERAMFSKTIEKELYTTVKEILASPEIIQPKAAAALRRIKEEHDPERHAQRLVEVYGLGK
ncbi:MULTISPECIES: glycosyltransferase family 4 protein [unclassified Carboxylicivirga]|uniref:glycosyltransferase family 4 protein n=1 Tax=Carboxylicivirga TaxID=1628153 RepID=UPI003D349C39